MNTKNNVVGERIWRVFPLDLSRLPTPPPPQHLYIHVPLPRNILLFYSDCCVDTYYPDHFG